MPSFYAPQLSPETQNLILSGDEAHHISRVFRHRVGDMIKLNSGVGSIAKAEITGIEKRDVELKILEVHSESKPAPEYAVAFSLLKSKHDEQIVEKVTELGAMSFYPLLTDYSVRLQSKNTVERFERISLAAIKQCDNPWLPHISEPMPLDTALKMIVQEGFTPLICSERKPEIWLYHIVKDSRIKPCFLVGPEGGWSEAELALFERQHFLEISISKLTLRAETAAIAIAAQWNMRRNRIV